MIKLHKLDLVFGLTVQCAQLWCGSHSQSGGAGVDALTAIPCEGHLGTRDPVLPKHTPAQYYTPPHPDLYHVSQPSV